MKHSEIADIYFMACCRGEVTTSEIVQFIELLEGFLNPITLAKYSKNKGLDYTVVLKQTKRQTNPLETHMYGGVKFIIDNE